MKRSLLFLFCCGLGIGAHAADRIIIAEDDSSEAAYKAGWNGGSGGSGLRSWVFQTLKAEGGHAGFFIAESANQPELKAVGIRSKGFGLYANGQGFEAATAFRALKLPLAVGQTFSFLLGHATIEKKFENDDPGTGAIGLSLRTGNATAAVGDYNQGARLEFGYYEGKATYQIFDGDTAADTGIPVTAGGLSVSVTLVTADTYDIEVTTLATMKTLTLKGRKLGGQPGARIESFCIFNRDGEKSDGFFNGFQVTGTGGVTE